MEMTGRETAENSLNTAWDFFFQLIVTEATGGFKIGCLYNFLTNKLGGYSIRYDRCFTKKSYEPLLLYVSTMPCWKEIAFSSKEATEGTKISCYALDNLMTWQTNKWESVIHILN